MFACSHILLEGFVLICLHLGEKKEKKVKMNLKVEFGPFRKMIQKFSAIFVVAGLFFITHWLVGLPAPYKKIKKTTTMKRMAITCEISSYWPDLDLMLTSPANQVPGLLELRNIFLQSAALFWPNKHLKYVVVTDSEKDFAYDFCNLTKSFTKKEFQIGNEARCFAVYPAFYCPGWHKSQWLRFWADNFTNSEFVGFIDTDTLFVSQVTQRDLFKLNHQHHRPKKQKQLLRHRPIVRPILGPPKQANVNYWKRVPERTFKYTGYNEPFNCMSYFPIIVKTQHLPIIREQIRRTVLPNGTFDQAFQIIVKGNFYSEYNMMCAIMWNQMRDEYEWKISLSSNYKLTNFPTTSGIVGKMLVTEPRVAIHWGHLYSNIEIDIKEILQMGVCYASMVGGKSSFCRKFPERWTSVNRFEFQFESDHFYRYNYQSIFSEHLKRLTYIEQCQLKHEINSAALGLLELQ